MLCNMYVQSSKCNTDRDLQKLIDGNSKMSFLLCEIPSEPYTLLAPQLHSQTFCDQKNCNEQQDSKIFK